MDKPQSGRCPECDFALSSDPKDVFGKLACPRCSANLLFVNTGQATRFVVRGSTHLVCEILDELLDNPPPDLDSLDFVELVMEIEEDGWNA